MKKQFSPRMIILLLLIIFNVVGVSIIFLLHTQPAEIFAQAAPSCSLVEANCTWDALSGVTSYSVKITEVDSGTVVKTDTVAAPATKYVFPITQGKKYQCDVSGVNSCGAAGAAGSASAVCGAEGLVASPSPIPITTAPLPTAQAAPTQCGYVCQVSSDCQSGLVCVTSGSGTGYCSMPNLQQQCGANPNVTSCCVPPTQPPQPTVKPTGSTENTIVAIMGVIGMISAGAVMLWKSSL